MRRRSYLAAIYGGAVLVLLKLHPLRGLPALGDVGSWLTTSPEAAVGVAAACAGWLIAAWVTLVLTALALTRCLPGKARLVAGGRIVRWLVPRTLRPLLHAAVGSALLLGPAAGPALAAADVAPVPVPVPAPVVAPPEPALPTLDWVTARDGASERPPGAAATPPTPPTPARTEGSPSTYRVVAGDTLWDLAAERLGAGASPAAITAAWQRIYAANRTVIGPDPSFLLVGDELLLGEVR